MVVWKFYKGPDRHLVQGHNIVLGALNGTNINRFILSPLSNLYSI